jgi:hypothetical protein
VEHYDLQTELVDHLANGIEQQWAHSPKLSFDEAKKMEFKKFGVFGFMEVVSERQKARGKKYHKIIWRFFKAWWSLPKLLMAISGILVLFIIIDALPKGDLRVESIAGVFYALDILLLYRTFQLKKEIDGAPKKWMLQEMIYRQGLTLQLFLIPLNFLNMANLRGLLDTFHGQLFIATLVVIMLILLKICGYAIPSKAEELLAEVYPEYNIEK